MKQYLLLVVLCATTVICAPEGTVLTSGFVSTNVPPSPTNAENGCIPTRTTQPDGRRLFTIYLPPNYDANDIQTRYPVVYWCTGFNGTVGYDGEPAEFNKTLLDLFINNGQIVPMIVVYPDPSLALTFQFVGNGCVPCPPSATCQLSGFPAGFASYGNSFYINSALNNVLYEDYFIQELVPYIDANYNTIADRNFRAISGHSMGGYGALLLGMRYPETFAALAAESPSPPWMFTDPQTWPVPPTYNAFSLNSVMIPGLLDASNPNNLASPCNLGYNGSTCAFNDFIFALSAALSPNTAGGTPFLDTYQVNLPIEVDANGQATLVNGVFDVVDFASPNADMYVVNQSVVLDPAVIAVWHQNDPFFQLTNHLDTLAQQAIYLDGGTLEPLNNVASRMVSDALMAYTIDNEYILYEGTHPEWLFDPCCARNTTVFKMCSAQFAAAGINIENSSAKLMGNVTISLYDDAQINIYDGTVLSVQTSRTIPDVMNPISDTNVTINLYDQSAIHIGDTTQQGGALQIGDPLTKTQLQEYNEGPANVYASHTVSANIHLQGVDTLLEIGKEGFLGLGIGVTGKSNSNLAYAPTVANFWSISSLANVNDITMNIEQGTFSHTFISSGDQIPASLFGIDTANQYSFSVNPQTAKILGGGNMICTAPDPNADPAFVGQNVRLLHPTVLNQGNTLPNPTLFLDPPAGVINVTNFQPNLTDPYINNPISTTTAYTNYFQRGMLQSTPLFDRGDVINPFALDTTSHNLLCDFLITKEYIDQPIKLANISSNPDAPTIGFIQSASFIDTVEIVEYAFPLIERRSNDELPVTPGQTIPFAQLAHQGAIGVQLEYINSSADLPEQNIFNLTQLIRVYDPHTQIAT